MHEAEIRINLAVIAKNCNQGTASICLPVLKSRRTQTSISLPRGKEIEVGVRHPQWYPPVSLHTVPQFAYPFWHFSL